MTQILTAGTPNFIVESSDRLVVSVRAGKFSGHDPCANKTVVYRSSDALVTIGFSVRVPAVTPLGNALAPYRNESSDVGPPMQPETVEQVFGDLIGTAAAENSTVGSHVRWENTLP